MIFVFPTEFEAAPFRALCPTAKIVICGVGMATTAATLCNIIGSKPNRIVLAGIAGSYDTDRFPINTVVEVISERIEELPAQFAITYHIKPHFSLPKASSNSVNRSNFEGAESDIEQMEGAAAAAICAEMGIAFSQIRAISNRVGDPIEKWSIRSAIETLATQLKTIYNE